MKKIVYTLGFALLAASCSEDYKDWSVSQTNPQEDALMATEEYQNKYHEKMWNNDLKHFAEDPAKAAAIIRNRTSKSCHVNFWRDYFHRLAEGFIADAPEWALKLCRLYEEKI